MKKILTVLLLVCCVSAAFAQRGAGRVLGSYTRLNEQVARTIQREIRFTSRQLRLVDELARYQFVPLKTRNLSTSWQTVLAVSSVRASLGNVAAASLSLTNDVNTHKLDANLENYLTHTSETEGTKFVFRGMHLADLDEMTHILLDGLEVDKTGYESVYVAASHHMAEEYAGTSKGGRIPVLVTMEEEAVSDYLETDIVFPIDGIYSSKTDIPADAISHLFAFLDINGKPAWYRVVLDDEMIFIPLPDEGQGVNTRLIP